VRASDNFSGPFGSARISGATSITSRARSASAGNERNGFIFQRIAAAGVASAGTCRARAGISQPDLFNALQTSARNSAPADACTFAAAASDPA
jgi:hypothetical protein